MGVNPDGEPPAAAPAIVDSASADEAPAEIAKTVGIGLAAAKTAGIVFATAKDAGTVLAAAKNAGILIPAAKNVGEGPATPASLLQADLDTLPVDHLPATDVTDGESAPDVDDPRLKPATAGRPTTDGAPAPARTAAPSPTVPATAPPTVATPSAPATREPPATAMSDVETVTAADPAAAIEAAGDGATVTIAAAAARPGRAARANEGEDAQAPQAVRAADRPATDKPSAPGAATVPKPPASSVGVGIAPAATAFAERIRALISAIPEGGEPTGSGMTTATQGQASTAGASAQSSPSPLPAAAAAVTLPRLAAEITRRVVAGETRFQIRLDPADLGRVEVQLEIGEKGETRTHLTVERRETFDLLARDQRGLERTLREAGFEARDGSVQISLKQNGDGTGERFAQQQSMQQERGEQRRAGPDAGSADTVETDLAAR
ncbi:MAG TPA: flagellar hook-length control protein FliK, partial [Methylomirabilota bacterium]|nr:flagellar hook-length control protein FliK [Methylomirabilota bacterium]